MAFFARYRKLKGDDTQEVQYNLGRAFHQLSTSFRYFFSKIRLMIVGSALYATAAHHYERVLELAEAAQPPVDLDAMESDDDDEDETAPHANDFSKVAAYNLSQIYLLSDSRERAVALSRKWLFV